MFRFVRRIAIPSKATVSVRTNVVASWATMAKTASAAFPCRDARTEYAEGCHSSATVTKDGREYSVKNVRELNLEMLENLLAMSAQERNEGRRRAFARF